MVPSVIAAAFAGVFTWTFLEYVIHRWLGHDRRFNRTPFAVEHLQHHVVGDYFAPGWKKALAAVVLTVALSALGSLVVPLAAGAAYVAGLMGFYLAYEVVHRRLHTHLGFGAYGRFLRRHHFHHHLVDGRTNHGVTTPLWDVVFGTFRRASHIKVPRKLCMAWLLDPATGSVREELSATWSLGK